MRISARHNSGFDLDRRGHVPAPVNDASARTQLPALTTTRTELPKAVPGRPVAALVAQLVAHVEDMPVTREHRRAEPLAGTDAYRSIAKLGPDSGPHTTRVI